MVRHFSESGPMRSSNCFGLWANNFIVWPRILTGHRSTRHEGVTLAPNLGPELRSESPFPESCYKPVGLAYYGTYNVVVKKPTLY